MLDLAIYQKPKSAIASAFFLCRNTRGHFPVATSEAPQETPRSRQDTRKQLDIYENYLALSLHAPLYRANQTSPKIGLA